jgi:hypothetical protein
MPGRNTTSFYFSLPRLVGKILGRGSNSSEGSSLEAYAGSLVIFVITYLFFVDLATGQLTGWKTVPLGIVLGFAVWIFWVGVLYLNSFLIQGLHLAGFFRRMQSLHLQDVLIGVLITLFSVELSIRNSWLRWGGILWLIFLLSNLAAALVLRLLPRGAATD